MLRLVSQMNLMFGRMDEANARAVLTWRYDAPYSFYNPNPAELGKDLQVLTDPNNQYYAITDVEGALVAYYCFGREAQVAGGDYSDDALDVGGGVRPDLTGRGLGFAVIHAGLSFGQHKFAPRAFRVTVAAFNKRALRVCEKTGFLPVQTFSRAHDERKFLILLRRA
jgi:ribosomal-protein-alanine N-acetyltransferase